MSLGRIPDAHFYQPEFVKWQNHMKQINSNGSWFQHKSGTW